MQDSECQLVALLVWVDPADFYGACSCVWGHLEIWLVVGSSKTVSLTFLTVGILLARGTAASMLCVFYHLAGFPGLLHMAVVGFHELGKNGSTNAKAIFEPVYTTFTVDPLARASHTTSLRPTIEGEYPKASIEREEFVAILVIYLGILCQIICTVWYIFMYHHF